MDTCDTRSIREFFHEYCDLAQITDPHEVGRLYDSLVAGPRVTRMARDMAAGLADATFDDDLEAE